MSAKSSVSGGRDKVAKPRPDFPLFPHATGRWAKKVRQKLHYFGRIADDPEGKAALNLWLDQKDDLLAGRKPRVRTGDELTVRELANRFLSTKQCRLDAGKLSGRSFQDYYATCERIVSAFGKNRVVDDLGPDDFESLWSKLAKRRGPVALGNEVIRVRSVFKYAFSQGLIEKPIRFGEVFRKPDKRELREARNGRGKRILDSAQLRTLLDYLDGKEITLARNDKKTKKPAKVQTRRNPIARAMVLLGLNCGYGPTDIARLPNSALDLKAGWADFPRPKTAVPRRCPLWRETIAAVREAITVRPEPKDAADGDLIFVTRTGQRWVRLNSTGSPDNAVSKEFAKALMRLDLKSPGVNFYSLRRVTETIGGECKDQVAVDAVMGHADNSMAAHYREGVSDERLKAVTDQVHEWLFPRGTRDSAGQFAQNGQVHLEQRDRKKLK